MPITQGKVYQVLEHLQEHVYNELGELSEYASAPNLDTFTSITEELLGKDTSLSSDQRDLLKTELLNALNSKLEQDKPPTRYESPEYYLIMMDLATEIEKSIREFSIPIPFLPAIGTLPTGRVNAIAILTESNDYLVVFESQLFAFANKFSKAIALCLAITEESNERIGFSASEDDIIRRLKENPEGLQRFQDVLLAYLIEGSPSAAEPYLIGDHYSGLSNALRESMELFIMGHEYSHIIHGHLSKERSQVKLTDNDSTNELVRSWEQEFEADITGLQLMLKALMRKGIDLSLCYLGADLFFSCNDVITQGVSVLSTGKVGTPRLGSHPPANLRRETLREALKRGLGENMASEIIKQGQGLEFITKHLISETKPTLFSLYKKGIKPAPIWQK